MAYENKYNSTKMMGNGLEEAAEDFVWEVMENDEEGISELSKKLRPTSKISDFYDALVEFFKAGAEWQKSQMLKDAVEVTVQSPLLGPPMVCCIANGCSDGDKVRIVVLKEEE